MLADEFREIRNLADELCSDLESALWQDEDLKVRLQGYLEEACSLMDDALKELSEI